jgi:hypothetical protein
MIDNKYNYSLNGIEHEIILNNNIKIDNKPIDQKILVSNKYILKYINDLFDTYNIDYSLVGNTLLGSYIFNGINIFNSKLEICTSDINFFKIKKLEQDIINDGFDIIILKEYIKISTIFFDKIKSIIYIYPLEKDVENDIFKYITIDKIYIYHSFYDIFPIKKTQFEEFEISIPNKSDKVLESYGFNLNFISFDNHNNYNNYNNNHNNNHNHNNQIIDEVEKQKISINSIINNVISVIKPFIFND